MKWVQEFKAFALRGNVVDMAVGVIIGAAFGKIVTSLVSDIVMPPIGLLVGNVDFSDLSLTLRAATAEVPAISLNYGMFLNTVINFTIVAFAIFVVIKQMNRLKREAPPSEPLTPTTKTCQFCQSSIHIAAVRCPNCTSTL